MFALREFTRLPLSAALWAVVFQLLFGALVFAAEPRGEPILRIETGKHTGIAYAITHDPLRDRLITVSPDKTARVWQLPDMRLVAVLRVPIETVREGQLTSLAISPDGATIAVGGWTGWEWDERGCVYLFDGETYELTRRIGGFAAIIGDLRFSPDGRFLAVGLHGRGGVAFLDTKEDFQVVAQDMAYEDRVVEMNFSPTGFMAATAFDGFIRIYDPEHKLVARRRSTVGSRPGAIQFSPDGRRVAVGFYDQPAVAVMSFPELVVSSTLAVTNEQGLASLRMVSWSRDGRSLFATGDYSGRADAPIFRWAMGQGEAPPKRLSAGSQRVSTLFPLRDGRLAFSTEDPLIGLIGADGRVEKTLAGDIADFRDGEEQFQISSDGDTVMVPMSRFGRERLVFCVSRLELGAQAKASALAPALRRSGRYKVEGWKDGERPHLNGKPLGLSRYETARSYAIAPAGERLYLGAEWSLRAFKPDGAQLWRNDVSGIVWNVAASGDGRVVVATLSDGTVRWYRADDGAEILAFFPHRNRSDWILWRPDGYYASSEYGDNFVGWHVNRGKDQAPDFFRAVQFERVFYRPDFLRNQIGAPATRGIVQSISPAQPLSISRIRDIAPPRIRVTGMRVRKVAGADRYEIAFEAQKNTLGMTDVTVYLNNLPITAYRDRTLAGAEQERFSRHVEVVPDQRHNTLRIEVGNGVSLGLYERYIPGAESGIKDVAKGDLYLVAVGANHFANIHGRAKERIKDLLFAAADAEALASVFQSRGTSQFRKVNTTIISDDADLKPTKANILEALDRLSASTADDTVLLFLASHGFSDKAGNYYFVPADALAEDIDSVLSGKENSSEAPSLISWRRFFDALRTASGRRILIVDTCQAEQVEGTFDSHSLKKRSAASLFSLLLASRGDEFSQEYSKARHGLFTHALLSGLTGAADANGDKRVSIDELHRYSLDLVVTLHDPRAGSQTPQLIAPEPLGKTAILRVDQ